MNNDQIRFVTYSKKTVGDLFSNLKDKTSLLESSGVVYLIPCKDCNNNYIGQAKNELGLRLKQHQYDCTRSTRNGGDGATALECHCVNDGHTFDFSQPRVLESAVNYKK